jgi:hypothetical protein
MIAKLLASSFNSVIAYYQVDLAEDDDDDD